MGNGHVHDNIEQYDELVTYAQQAQLFRNGGAGVFREVTAESGPAFAAFYVVRGSSFGDIDQDGDLDIALVNNGRRFALLRNDGPRGNYLAVALEGRQSNRDGIGARLYLWAGGRRQLREVKAGSGFLSTSQRDPVFGLGTGRAHRAAGNSLARWRECKCSKTWPSTSGCTWWKIDGRGPQSIM